MITRRLFDRYTDTNLPIWVAPAAIGLVWIACQIIVFRMLGDFAFPLDDAYIVLHNAQVLTGGDRNFAGVPPLIGSTSLLETLAAALLLTVLSGPLTLWLLAWLGILAAATGFHQLAGNLGCARGTRLAIVAAALLAGQPLLVMLNGVETGWAVAAAAWALGLTAAPRIGRRLPMLCAVLPFVRPELGALAVFLMVDQGWRRYLASSDFRAGAREFGVDIVVAAAITLPLLSVQWLGSGTLIPNTAAAKQYFYATAQLPLATKIAVVVQVMIQFGLILGPLFVALFIVQTRIARLGSLLVAAVLVSHVWFLPIGGYINDYRYLYIFIPVMAANLASALNGRKTAWRKFAVAVMVSSVAWNLITLAPTTQTYIMHAKDKLATMDGLVAWVRSNLSNGELLLIHDIGYLAWATDQPMNDLVGLKSPQNIDIHRQFTTYGPFGLAESTEQIALRSGARILVVSWGWEPKLQIAEGLRLRGWTLQPMPNQSKLYGYDVYRLSPPEHLMSEAEWQTVPKVVR